MQFGAFAIHTIRSLPITAKTRQNYVGVYERHIGPSLSQFELDVITRRQVQQVLAPLPPQTAYQALMVMKSIYREAIAMGLMQSAPTDRVRSPRITVQPVRFLRWEEIAGTSFGRYTEHVQFLALHGLRWGEAAVLSEADIWDDRVHITKSIHGAPKSAAGVRTVPYLGHFTPFSQDRRGLARALKPFGVTIHSLRHTYAYILKTNGVHVTTAQKLLGHANVALTLAVYTAVLDDEIDAVGVALRQIAGMA